MEALEVEILHSKNWKGTTERKRTPYTKHYQGMDRCEILIAAMMCHIDQTAI